MVRKIFKKFSLVLVLVLTIGFVPTSFGKICPRCGVNHLPDDPPKPTQPAPKPKQEPTPTEQTVDVLSVNRDRFAAPSVEIADACDLILDRLETRYGKPRVWKPFPIYFKRYTGNGIAGYTQYSGGKVVEVVVYESLENAIGGTLDH